MVKDMCGKDKISTAAIFSLELEADSLNLTAPPEPKRGRVDSLSSVTVKDRLAVYCSVKKVLQGQPPPPRLWKTLGTADNSTSLAFLLKVRKKWTSDKFFNKNEY